MARLIAVGLVAGVFSALFGVGGGIVIVPLLVLLLHLPTHEATATSLGAIGITALAGVVAYALRDEVQVGHALLVGLPAAVAAYAGAGIQRRLSGRALTLAFAALLVAVGAWLIAG